jgi:hypothetical protein
MRSNRSIDTLTRGSAHIIIGRRIQDGNSFKEENDGGSRRARVSA